MSAEPVVIRLHIDAPPDVVFDCFCDPAGLVAVASDPATRFGALVDAFAGNPGITPPDDMLARGRKFGSNALKVNNKIFAMLRQDRLVVKLPGERVGALVGAGHGERMVSGGGRVMKEWLVVDKASGCDWTALAREACEFVAREA